MDKDNLQRNTRSKYEDKQQAMRPLPAYLLIVIVVPLLIIIIIGGYFFYDTQEQHWKQQLQDRLTSIAQLKTDQIALWRTERIADAEYLKESTLYIEGIATWIETGDDELEQDIHSQLEAIGKDYPYQDILLVSPAGDILISINNIVTELKSASSLSLPVAFESRESIFVDFHNSGSGQPHLVVIAPLHNLGNNTLEPLAAVILCMDPNYILYPLVNYWPTSSDSAETLIVRSEGDQVLFLNELRHQTDTALKLRIPVTQKEVPAVAAIGGYEGYFEGIDYRGIEVVSVVQRIPDSPWYMVAKEDKAEAFAETRLNSLLIIGTFAGLIILIVGIGIVLWQRRQRKSLQALYNSEIERKALMRHFEYLVKYANDMILLADDKYNIVDANEKAMEIYGYTKEEFYKLQIEDLIPDEHFDSYKKRRDEITRKGSIRSEAIHRKKDGTSFPVEVSIKPVEVEGVKYEQAIIRDITDRKKAEDALSHSEGFLKTIIESSPYSMCITDSSGMVIQLNRACRNLFRANKRDIAGKYNILEDNIIEEQGFMPLVRDIFTKGKTAHFTVTYNFSKLKPLSLKNDREVVLDTTISAVTDNNDVVTNAIIQHTDITERSIMEEQLRTVNRLYALLSNINQTIVRTGDIDELYKAICKIAVKEGGFRMAWIGLMDKQKNDIQPLAHYGKDDGYIEKFYKIRRDYPEYTSPTDRALTEGKAIACNNVDTDIELPALRDLLLQHNFYSLAAVALRHRGKVIGNLTLYANTRGFFSEREISLFNEIGTDISFAIDSIMAEKERENIQKELHWSEEKLTSIFDTAPAGIGITVNQIIQEVNHSLCEMLGYTREELINSNASIIYASVDDYESIRKEMNRKIKSGNLYTEEIKWRRKDGEMIDVMMNATKMDMPDFSSSVVFTALNITEKKLLAEEQQRIGKLESIGLLAGGIAHDFNNILTAILGNVNLARLQTSPDEEINTLLLETEKASIRAQSLTQQLLTFAKGGAPIKKVSSVAEIIKEAASFVLMGSNVKCEFSIPDDLWKADIDAGQITQVVSNLVINAQQAMPAGGTIEITCKNEPQTEMQESFKKLQLKEGNYIGITITDHGTGIAPEYLNNIFDPYFTTKQTGSGLGLTIVYSIIRNHNGYIGVESKVGKGTTFSIYLPAYRAKVTSRETERKQLPLEKGRILVMDDEEVVRNVAGHMLSYLGFDDVTFTENGEEAIEKYKEASQAGRPYAAVILDLTIPGGMGGKATIKELLHIDPTVKAIVSSGYTNEQVITEFKQHGFSGIVTKPYTIEQLSDVLNEVLKKKPKEQS